MATRLDEIVAATRVRVAERKRCADMRALESQAERHVPRGFRRALLDRAQQGPAVIAELKKASPSKGVLRATMHVGNLANQLMRNGAAALSVLTEEDYFQGSLANLREAAAACGLPCLRKDFIVDEFQVVEARAHQADAVLLLASVLDDRQLERLHTAASALGLDVLCEAHDDHELERALAAGCDMVGVNSRDLRTFAVSLDTPLRLVQQIPAGIVKVAESGIASGANLRQLRAAGYEAFLIGELLMRAEYPGAALRALLAEAMTEVPSTT